MPRRYSAYTQNPRVHPPVWKCIYCDATGVPLSKEHIIPRALNGASILLKACCGPCQKIIHRFETLCLKQNFLDLKTYLKFRTRHPKDQRPAAFTAKVDGSPRSMPFDRFAPPLFLPKFSPPNILTGGEPTLLGGFGVFAAVSDQTREALTAGGAEFQVAQKFNVQAFSLMLAKIAHGFAWAELGPQHFTHMLPDYILGKRPELGPHLVGRNCSRQFGPSAATHEVKIAFLGSPNGYVVGVLISLFHQCSGPQYCVVAGRLVETPELLDQLNIVREGYDLKEDPR